MGDDKKAYWEDYSKGQADANRVKTTAEIVHEAVIPGTLPSEKGPAYKAGHDAGKAEAKKNKGSE